LDNTEKQKDRHAPWKVFYSESAGRYLFSPVDFEWDLDIAGMSGQMAVCEAVKYGALPDNFNQWGKVEESGLTVLAHLLERQRQDTYFMAKWTNEKPLCKRAADWMVFKTELPEVYYKYAVQEHMDNNIMVDSHLL
jgi:hypothetical protein